MNRKRQNTITALTIASLGLGLALMVAQSAMPRAPLTGLSVSPVDPAHGLRDTADSAVDTSVSTGKSRPSRRMRQTVAMPFFSFAPRG